MVQDSRDVLSKIEDSEENRKKCHCPYCPSYPECGGDILYCGKCPSNTDIKAKGCICDTCAVYYENKLKSIYYCNKRAVGNGKLVMRKKSSSEDDSFYQNVVNIKDLSASGESIVTSMGSTKKIPFSFEDLHFVPAQIKKIPLNREDDVKTQICIGPKSKKPFKVSSPILVSGMSFGAVSPNVKIVIAETASKLNIGFNSGEGGIPDEEGELSQKQRIVQYSTGRFGVDENVLKNAAAIEIRFGQGAYPGKGSYLPASKMNSEVASIRGLKTGEAAYSPAHHPDIKSAEDVAEKVSWLRKISGGAPVGAKIGCGDVEGDLEILVDAGVDFISLDGFGGGTGATDLYVRDNVGLPIIAALPRAFRHLQELGVKDRVSLIAGGSLHSSADFAKCLALGADAVYIGTAALIAINCEQYRICYTGLCPTGVTTQNPQLLKQLDVDEGVLKLTNFITLSTKEIANLTRIVGKDDISKLDKDDLVSIDKDLSQLVGVKWLNGKYL